MSLRSRKSIESHINDSIFGVPALAHPLPKYRFPQHENRPSDIFQVVSDELFLDGNARQNLATFCQTWEEPEVHQLMNLSIDKNMIDKTEYPQTAEIEITDIIDRVGSGDAFAAGVLHGWLSGGDARAMAEAGLALGALKHGLYGDFCRMERAELAAFTGAGGDVRR